MKIKWYWLAIAVVLLLSAVGNFMAGGLHMLAAVINLIQAGLFLAIGIMQKKCQMDEENGQKRWNNFQRTMVTGIVLTTFALILVGYFY